MRISDWSSDVCSSDLSPPAASCTMNAPTDRMASALLLPQPYVLFLGDTTVRGYAKTAFGLRDWAPEKCVGELRLPGATVTAGLDAVTAAEARERGARALVHGVANQGSGKSTRP